MTKLNSHPTVELKVQRYELQEQVIAREQMLKRLENVIEQIEKESARLDELNSNIDALLFSSSTSSTPHQSTPDSSEA